MKKIQLEVCTGTTCYLMGGAEILDALDNLPPLIKEKIQVQGMRCLGLCRRGAKPPFIKVDGLLLEDVTWDRLLMAIEGGNHVDHEE